MKFVVVAIFESVTQLYMEKLRRNTENNRGAVFGHRDLTPGPPEHEIVTKGHILKIYLRLLPLKILVTFRKFKH
jgi:hypothetical protein